MGPILPQAAMRCAHCRGIVLVLVQFLATGIYHHPAAPKPDLLLREITAPARLRMTPGAIVVAAADPALPDTAYTVLCPRCAWERGKRLRALDETVSTKLPTDAVRHIQDRFERAK